MTVEELISKRETVETMTDDELVVFAWEEKSECGSNSDYVVDEFEKRMVSHGCPTDRVAATQIDYINSTESLKQFAERIRNDQDF